MAPGVRGAFGSPDPLLARPAEPSASPASDTAALELRSPETAAPEGRVSASRNVTAACYVDFENLFYSSAQHGHVLSVARVVRHLNRLGRQTTGVGWSAAAVYASWDAIVTRSRHAQDDWAMMGWRTVAVPTREDYLSTRPVKNLVDFVMSLDILEDARDRGWGHIAIVTGDADFCEVVERLKRLGRRVTVVSLKPSLSFRLQQAADEVLVWSFDDITGDESIPVQSYRRIAQVAAPAHIPHAEDPYQVLMRAVRLAEREQGVAPVSWRVIRDEYFLRWTRMSETEADRFAWQLNEGGFVTMVKRRQRDGTLQIYLSIPR